MGMRARKPEVAAPSRGSGADHSSLPAVSWKEVAKHCTVEDCWITVDDIAYDLTDWLHKHPGGQELMLTFAGREGTQAFNSYHCFAMEKATATLRNFAVARVTDSEFQEYPKENKIYTAITERVKGYFEKNKVDPKDWRPGFFHFLTQMLTAFVSCLFIFQYIESHALVQVFFAVILGCMQAMPLLHIMHDCSHGAFSHAPLAWNIFGNFTMDVFAGVSMTAWHLQHVVGHHVWTNVFEADPDLPGVRKGDPRRLVDKQEQAPQYKYQHIYLPIAYGILALKVRLSDVQHLTQPMAGPLRVRQHTTGYYIYWAVTKMMWATWKLVVPLYFMKVSLGWYLVLALISDLITGWYLALNFQVSHVSTEASYPFGSDSCKSNTSSDEWAVSQIKTSVDYDHGNSFVTWACGALNYQTVHHLFPGVSQYHYPKIAPIIMEVCKENGVKYNVLPDFNAALWAHIAYLKEMGEKGITVPVHMG